MFNKNKLRNRRAVSNIIATMLIFAMMIVSMGVLYQQIAPVILGFNAKSLSTNQEFVLINIQNELEDLVSSPEGSQSRINIVANEATYNVSYGHSLTVNVNDGVGILINPTATITENIGDFSVIVDGSFQYELNEKYLSRVIDETSLISDDNADVNTNFVSKVQYSYTSANFELYSRARVDVVNTSATSYVVSVTIVQVYFNTLGGFPTDFPIQDDEWTLRLRRMPSVVTTISASATGPFTIDHLIDSVSSITSYSFGTADPSTITLKFIVIPILFST